MGIWKMENFRPQGKKECAYFFFHTLSKFPFQIITQEYTKAEFNITRQFNSKDVRPGIHELNVRVTHYIYGLFPVLLVTNGTTFELTSEFMILLLTYFLGSTNFITI